MENTGCVTAGVSLSLNQRLWQVTGALAVMKRTVRQKSREPTEGGETVHTEERFIFSSF